MDCGSLHAGRLCLWLGLVTFAGGGCATLFSDPTQHITITSNVEGAEVLLNGMPIGRTPLRHELDRSTFDEFQVVLRHAGHETREFRIQKSLNATALFNCTSWPSWGTDMTTGAMMEYSPNSYYIEMKSKPQARPDDALRLEAMRLVVMSRENLLWEIAAGDGEHLRALAHVMRVPPEQILGFGALLRERLPLMANERYPHRIMHHVETVTFQLGGS